MRQPIRDLGRRLAPGLLMTLLCLGAIPPAAAESGPASLAPPHPAADAPQIDHEEYWRARADTARAWVAATRERLDAANHAVSLMRRRNHPRGEARDRLRAEQATAKASWEAAVHVLEVELPAVADAAGAEPDWLRQRS